MGDFSHLITKSILDGNKKIVTTIDAESNRVLRKVNRSGFNPTKYNNKRK